MSEHENKEQLTAAMEYIEEHGEQISGVYRTTLKKAAKLITDEFKKFFEAGNLNPPVSNTMLNDLKELFQGELAQAGIVIPSKIVADDFYVHFATSTVQFVANAVKQITEPNQVMVDKIVDSMPEKVKDPLWDLFRD